MKPLPVYFMQRSQSEMAKGERKRERIVEAMMYCFGCRNG
jgi:hypothetical protein